MHLLLIPDLNSLCKSSYVALLTKKGPKFLIPCAENVLFIQGARGNDGLPGPAGPPVSIIFNSFFNSLIVMSLFLFNQFSPCYFHIIFIICFE